MKTDFANLPKHWKIKKLKEIVVKQTGTKPIHRFSQSTADNLPEWDIESLENNKTYVFADWYSTIHAFDNDIFVVRTGGRNGMIIKGKQGVVGSTLFCLTPLINSEYLFFYLKSTEFQYSSTRDLQSFFWEMEIPIPPIEEQKYIVQSIQEAYQSYENENKIAERNLLDSFRKLVPVQSEILDKIVSLEDFKKEVLILAINGKLGLNDSNKWQIKTFSDLTIFIGSGITPKGGSRNYKKDGIPFLRSQNIHKGYISFNNVVYISEELHQGMPRTKIRKKDVLLNITGNSVGRVAVVPDSLTEGNVNQHVCILRFLDEINPYFISIYLNSGIGQSIISKLLTGSAMQGLNYLQIKKITINLPPFKEQTEIFNLVETIFTEADKIQQNFDLQKKQQDDLIKSIINSFFEFSTFPTPTTDWDLEALIKEAREKKEKEIKILKEKQMKKKKEQELLNPKKNVYYLLKESNNPETGNDLLENSKYNNNIGEFFEEVKNLDESGLIKIGFQENTKDTEKPLSVVSLVK